jgi:hypothetical protein
MRPIRWAAAATVALAAVTGFQANAYASPAAAHPHSSDKPTHVSYQLGIDLDFYWHAGMKVSSDITADAKYARALGANTVMISFPFYSSAEKPYVGSATPSPHILAEAISAARAQGLQVGVRPLLDEANLPRSRPWFKPDDVATWLGTYASLIVPYARAAQQAGADRFWTGTELTLFAHDTHWAQVTRAVRSVFKGQLYFAANWVTPSDSANLPGSGGPGVAADADAYPVIPYPLSRLHAEWASMATVLPRGTVLSEVGIAARAGSQAHPYAWKPSSAPLYPREQVAWFTAACEAVATDHLGGIYFWSVDVGRSLTVKPTPQTANQFTASPGATAIKACFKTLSKASG